MYLQLTEESPRPPFPSSAMAKLKMKLDLKTKEEVNKL